MSEEHILIVEDDETIHNMIDEYLEKDYICVDAYSGACSEILYISICLYASLFFKLLIIYIFI